MNKFLKKLLMFSLLLALLTQSKVFLNVLSGPYWGNKVIDAKIRYLKETPKFDIIFLGSSRTYRHILPRAIDSLLDVRAFNLGGGGTWNPETWYILDHLVEDLEQDKRPKYLIIELQQIVEVSKRNRGTARSEYFLDFKRMKLVINHYLEENDLGNVGIYSISFLNKYLLLSTVKEQVKSSIKRTRYYENNRQTIDKSGGYLSLENDFSDGHVNRRAELLSNPNSLEKRKKGILLEFENSQHEPSTYEIFLHKGIKKLCESRNIIPIFIKPPRSYELLGLYQSLNNAKIDMSNPSIYPEFYSIENSYDIGHLNEKGAELYSIELAKKLGELID